MNIVEWRFYVENTAGDSNDDLRAHVGIIPGVLNSKFVKHEGCLTITMDTDLCTQDEIIEAMTLKPNKHLLPVNLEMNLNMNHFIKKLFNR